MENWSNFSFNIFDRNLGQLLKPMIINELNNDQRREFVNTQQRFVTYRDVQVRLLATRGSMSWVRSKGAEYLARSYYEKSGVRKQTSLGRRSSETESLKSEFERSRAEIQQRAKDIGAALDRQAAINRAFALARLPMIGARILRAIDKAGMLGAGLRLIGTNAIFGYEAAAGVMVDAGLMATEDIDLLIDNRGGLRFVVSEDVAERSLLNVLRSVDSSFEKTRRPYRAQNAQGYMVDLIKPMRNPPWQAEASQVGDNIADDLTASEIAGLVWLENAPSFEQMVIDDRGYPLRIVAPDPRVWAAHKLWVSKQADRDPVKKRRDEQQARTIGAIVRDFLPHLPYESEALLMLPRDVFAAAAPLFA